MINKTQHYYHTCSHPWVDWLIFLSPFALAFQGLFLADLVSLTIGLELGMTLVDGVIEDSTLGSNDCEGTPLGLKEGFVLSLGTADGVLLGSALFDGESVGSTLGTEDREGSMVGEDDGSVLVDG